VTRNQTSQIAIGLVLVLIGLAILERRLGLGWNWSLARFWPVIFFVFAAGQLANTEGRLLLARATWFTFLGTIFLLHTFRVVPLRDSWPLFIVAGGVALLMEQIACQLGRGRPRERE